MKVSLDGGVTFVEAPQGVRVTYERLEIPGEDERGVLLVNCTDEGLILDVWVDRGDAEHNIATSSETVPEILERMIDADC